MYDGIWEGTDLLVRRGCLLGRKREVGDNESQKTRDAHNELALCLTQFVGLQLLLSVQGHFHETDELITPCARVEFIGFDKLCSMSTRE